MSQSSPIFAFTDCQDSNAITRLTARLTAVFKDKAVYATGINSDIEASGCILDTLDALRKGLDSHIIIGNLAPRTEKKHKNGAPFYYGFVGDEIIVANYTCFALIAKLGLITTIHETDVETVCREFLDEQETKRIATSQFRSFEYVPLLAHWVYEKKEIPSIETTLSPIVTDMIWWIDNFGNIKTTITNEELRNRIVDGHVTFNIHDEKVTLPFFEKLSEVPVGQKAVITGSSGYENTRFAEIVIQGQSAQKEFNVKVGDKLI